MLNNGQIKLVQIAVRAAGIRTKESEGRYRLLLAQYKQPGGKPVTSCKQLNRYQIEDILAICESLGWQYPGKDADHYRNKVRAKYKTASFAKQSAIRNMAGDLGWDEQSLAGFIGRMTGAKKTHAAELDPGEADKILEGLKAMLSRRDGRHYTRVEAVADQYNQHQDDDDCPLPTLEELSYLGARDGTSQEAGGSNCDRRLAAGG